MANLAVSASSPFDGTAAARARGREIDFVKVSPTQNMTVLVTSVHPVEEYRDIALKIMPYGHVYAEQVGFIRKPESPDADVGLHMAAGEFCGNACMAVAAVYASEKGLDVGEPTDVVMQTSGTEELVRCRVRKRPQEYFCRLTMPVPRTVERSALTGDDDGDSAVVLYDNSLHVVIEADELNPTAREKAQSLAVQLGETMSMPLVGVMVYTPSSNQLAPLIHVPSLGSLVWERGCGSGTASLGAYLVWKNNAAVATEVVQPGGTMHVAADYEQGKLTDIRIWGSVQIVAKGKAYIDGVTDAEPIMVGAGDE